MDYISKAALMGKLTSSEEQQKIKAMSGADAYNEFLVLVNAMEKTDVAPVRHGRWIDRYGGKYENALYQCSECKARALYKPQCNTIGSMRFVQKLSERCPQCGAYMGGAENA